MLPSARRVLPRSGSSGAGWSRRRRPSGTGSSPTGSESASPSGRRRPTNQRTTRHRRAGLPQKRPIRERHVTVGRGFPQNGSLPLPPPPQGRRLSWFYLEGAAAVAQVRVAAAAVAAVVAEVQVDLLAEEVVRRLQHVVAGEDPRQRRRRRRPRRPCRHGPKRVRFVCCCFFVLLRFFFQMKIYKQPVFNSFHYRFGSAAAVAAAALCTPEGSPACGPPAPSEKKTGEHPIKTQ